VRPGAALAATLAILGLVAGASRPHPAQAAEFRSLGEKAAVLYDAPSLKADRLFVASRFYPFEVLVKLDQWTKVRDANGEVAWLENRELSALR